MSEWPVVRFEDLADGSKSAFSKPYGSAILKEDYLPVGVPVVRGVNLRNGIFVDDDFVYISAQKANQMPGANLTSGDLVFTHRGTIGQVSMIPRTRKHERYVLSTSHVKARLDGCRAFPEFYYYYFSSPLGQQEIQKHISTVGVPGLVQPVATIKSLPVPHPPIGIQQAIARLLGALDDKIAVNDRIAAAARNLAHAHFQSAIESADLRRVGISDVSEFVTRGVSPRYVDGRFGLRVLNQKCVRDGRVSLGPSRWTLPDKVPSNKLLQVNDVLVNSTGMGTLGRVARWTREGACTVDSHVSIVRFDVAKIDPVCAGFAMLGAESEIETLGEGSTGQTELSRARLSGLKIAVPSRQREIELRATLDALEVRGDTALRESNGLAELRDTLLPKLMSGEIRVKDAEKVVEDVT
jgi:type I restriction enzyme S subunit